MVKAVEFIWSNGHFIRWNDAKLHHLTHTLHYGGGVFEGIRCYNTISGPAVFRLDDHVERLFTSAKIMRMKIPYSREQISEAIRKTVSKNKLKACYIRPLVYYGYGAMGLNTINCKDEVSITVWPWGTYLGEEALEKGIKTIFSKSVKRETSPVANAKICGNYVKSIIAKREAMDAECDEAILLDDKGFVAEGSGENLFMVNGNEITTPALGAILPGITRASIMQLARDMGFRIKEDNIDKKDLYKAEEVFLCGTAAEVTPVSVIDSKIIGIGKRGKVTTKLQQKFFEVVKGEDERYEKWLTYVR